MVLLLLIITMVLKFLFHTEFHDLQHILISSITLERSRYASYFLNEFSGVSLKEKPFKH